MEEFLSVLHWSGESTPAHLVGGKANSARKQRERKEQTIHRRRLLEEDTTTSSVQNTTGKTQTTKEMAKTKTTTKSSKGNSATLEDNMVSDLENVREEIADVRTLLRGKTVELQEWNGKSDNNITLLMERVKQLEEDARKQETESLDVVIKEKLDAFVAGDFKSIVEGAVTDVMVRKNIKGDVKAMVDGLLGTVGAKGGSCLSTK